MAAINIGVSLSITVSTFAEKGTSRLVVVVVVVAVVWAVAVVVFVVMTVIIIAIIRVAIVTIIITLILSTCLYRTFQVYSAYIFSETVVSNFLKGYNV
jgi:hypothetical protein